jgi:hypothetical protein
MTNGKLSCWNTECPDNDNWTCFKYGASSPKYCKDFEDSPENTQLKKALSQIKLGGNLENDF